MDKDAAAEMTLQPGQFAGGRDEDVWMAAPIQHQWGQL